MAITNKYCLVSALFVVAIVEALLTTPLRFVGLAPRFQPPGAAVPVALRACGGDGSGGDPWATACKQWLGIVSARPKLEAGYFIHVLHRHSEALHYGRIDKVDGPNAYVQIGLGVLISVNTTNSIWSYVPEDFVERAKAAVDAYTSMNEIVQMASKHGVQTIVLAEAAEGLKGAARITSGLKNLGGGSMVGGIIVVTAYPSKMTADALANLAKAVSNNPETTNVVRYAGYGGAAGGTLVAVVLVAEGGTAGLSAAGITSGLAALGGTMIDGLACVAIIAVGITIAVSGIAYLYSNASAQRELKRQRKELEELALVLHFKIRI